MGVVNNPKIYISDYPEPGGEDNFDVVAIMAAILFPLVFFFQFPLYVGIIMHDKEKRLLQIMKMVGFLWFVIANAVTCPPLLADGHEDERVLGCYVRV